MDFLTNLDLTASDSITSLIKFIIVYLLLMWVSIVVWVIKDVTNRSTNILMHVIGVASTLLFPIFGVCIYLLIRPQRTLFEQYYENELAQLDIEAFQSYQARMNEEVYDEEDED